MADNAILDAVFQSWLVSRNARTLATLAGRYQLGIVSNFDTRVFQVLRGLGIAELFDTVTLSSLAQAVKPSPRIFQVALEKHAVDPDEALHVGDSIKDDVEGAHAAGMVGVWLDRNSKEREESPGFEGYRVHSLAELPDLMKKLSDA